VDIYETAQYNKRTCGIFINRAKASEVAIKALMKQTKDNHNFRQGYYDSFQRFINCLKQIKEFCIDISQLLKFKKFVTSGNIEDSFEKLIREFDICSRFLNLAVSINTKEQMDKDLAILRNDIVEMVTSYFNVINFFLIQIIIFFYA